MTTVHIRKWSGDNLANSTTLDDHGPKGLARAATAPLSDSGAIHGLQERYCSSEEDLSPNGSSGSADQSDDDDDGDDDDDDDSIGDIEDSEINTVIQEPSSTISYRRCGRPVLVDANRPASLTKRALTMPDVGRPGLSVNSPMHRASRMTMPNSELASAPPDIPNRSDRRSQRSTTDLGAAAPASLSPLAGPRTPLSPPALPQSTPPRPDLRRPSTAHELSPHSLNSQPTVHIHKRQRSGSWTPQLPAPTASPRPAQAPAFLDTDPFPNKKDDDDLERVEGNRSSTHSQLRRVSIATTFLRGFVPRRRRKENAEAASPSTPKSSDESFDIPASPFTTDLQSPSTSDTALSPGTSAHSSCTSVEHRSEQESKPSRPAHLVARPAGERLPAVTLPPFSASNEDVQITKSKKLTKVRPSVSVGP